MIKTEITIGEIRRYPDSGLCDVQVIISAFNTDTVVQQARARLEVYPNSPHYEDSIPLQWNIEPGKEQVNEYHILLPAGSYAFGIASEEAVVLSSYGYADIDMQLTEDFQECASYYFSDCGKTEEVRFAIKDDLLMIQSELLKKHSMVLYTAVPTARVEGEVLFSIRETDMGKAPAMVLQCGKAIPAPHLRNYEEITYVYQNQPRVECFKSTKIGCSRNGVVYVSLEKLGLGAETEQFLLELELSEYHTLRYSCCLFHSQNPVATAHMFVRVQRDKNKIRDKRDREEKRYGYIKV